LAKPKGVVLARYTHVRNNFLMGEVSPRIYGRTDLDQYNQMCESLINFTPLPLGGVRRRRGTKYLAEVHANHTTQNIKIIPYLTPTQNYFIVLSEDQADIYETDGTFVDSTVGGFAVDNLTYSQYGSFLVCCNGSDFPYVFWLSGSTLNYNIWGAGTITFPDSGSISGAYPEASTLPWLDENTTATTIKVSHASGSSRTMTASTGIFTSAHVGTYYRIRSGTTCALVYVSAYTSSTVVTVNIVSTTNVPAAAVDPNTVTTWSECAWGRFGGPRAVSFFQERIYFSGSSTFPDRVWASQIGDMWELSPPDPTASVSAGSDGSFSIDLNLGAMSLINFISPGEKLFIGSNSREAILEGINPDYGIGVLNARCVPQTNTGAAFAMPQRSFNVCSYIDKGLRRIIESTFSQEEESYKSFDLNKFADHLFAPGGITSTQSLKEIAWSPDQKIMWAVTTKRDLFSMTRDLETGAMGWARHVIGGSGTSSGSYSLDTTNPSVVTIACIQDAIYGYDEIFMVVARTINGNLERYIEKMSYISSDYFDIEDMNDEHLDCSITGYDAVAKTSWPALAAHLPSTSVHVMADGIYIGTKTLSAAGNLTLDTAANYVSVGFNYESTLIPVALQSNSLFGSGLGQIKRTEEITILFDRTVFCKFGVSTDPSNLEEINFREDSVAAEDPTPLFTGEKVLKLNASYETQQKLLFKVDEPLPCTINAVVAKGVLYD
jgi:hypothetical protein